MSTLKLEHISNISSSGNDLSIDTSGRLGIGTETPQAILHSYLDTVSANIGLILEQNNSGQGIWMDIKPGNNTDDWQLGANNAGFAIYNTTDARYDLVIKNDGNIGIGTDAPATSAKLHLYETGATSLFLRTENSAGHLLVGNNAAGNSFVSSQTTGKNLILEVENNPKLTLYPNISTVGYLAAQSVSQVRLVLGSEGSYNNNTSNWIRGNGTSLQFNNAGGGYAWEQTGTKVAELNSSGDLGIGNITASERLHVGVGGRIIANVSSNWQQSSLGTHLFRGGHMDGTISNDTTAIKIFPASSTARTTNYYHSGIGFMHLDPENSTWGTSYTGAHGWLGMKIFDTPGQERSSMVFATNSNTTAGTSPLERMAIHPSGYVTKPYQPRFFYTGGTSLTDNTIVTTRPSIAVIASSNYSTSTGRFTAPINGTYVFGVWGLLYPSNTNTMTFYWLKNGAQYGQVVQDQGKSSHQKLASTVIVELNLNDYFEFAINRGTNTVNAYSVQWQQWGYLLG